MPENRSPGGSGDGLSPEAAELEAHVRGIVDDLVEPGAGPSPDADRPDPGAPTSPTAQAPDPGRGGAAGDRAGPTGSQRGVVRDVASSFSGRFVVILVLVAILGIAAVALIELILGDDPGEATASTGDGPAVVAPADPGQDQPEQADAGALGTPEACALPADRVAVSVSDVSTDIGKRDPSMFVTTWWVHVASPGNAPVTVSEHVVRSENGSIAPGTPGWGGVGHTVTPGEVLVLGPNSIDNNTSGRAGELEWGYVDRVLVLRDTPQCALLHDAPTAELEALAVPAAMPALPDGVVLPTE